LEKMRVIAVLAIVSLGRGVDLPAEVGRDGASTASHGEAESGQSLDVLEGTWTARYAGRRGEAPDTSRIYLQFNYDTSNMGQSWPAGHCPAWISVETPITSQSSCDARPGRSR
jgi:hypothetical protein